MLSLVSSIKTDDMASFWRRILQFPVAIVMVVYYALTAVIEPIVTPMMRAVARLKLAIKLRAAIEALGPYPSLILLAIPVIIIEPLKIGSLAIMGEGHFALGAVALAASHALSLIIIERLFEVVKPKLLTIGWFAVIWGWFTALRDRLMAWLRATWAWSVVLRVRDATRPVIAGWIRRLRGR